jgi:hypothetical protein
MKARQAIGKLKALNMPGALITASFFNLIIDALDDLDTRVAALERRRRVGTSSVRARPSLRAVALVTRSPVARMTVATCGTPLEGADPGYRFARPGCANTKPPASARSRQIPRSRFRRSM